MWSRDFITHPLAGRCQNCIPPSRSVHNRPRSRDMRPTYGNGGTAHHHLPGVGGPKYPDPTNQSFYQSNSFTTPLCSVFRHITSRYQSSPVQSSLVSSVTPCTVPRLLDASLRYANAQQFDVIFFFQVSYRRNKLIN
ncbi:hypothetical protein ACN38_g3231 [Penicillium nordicum]|uniref:Uncharacterized protein n=1 Tax=Penicillium nordicum TaxID=229535 RepID=A0A0M8PDA1_9EURO|nr:hypothetical protein ACN38_g3231 [Penicillium nordicum]